MSTQFDWDMGGGTATIGLNATYVLKYDIDATIVDGNQVAAAFDAAGKLNYQTTAFPLPQLKGNVFVEYSNGAHNIRYTMNYIDDYMDQRVAEFLPSLATNRHRDLSRQDHRQHDVPRPELPAAAAVGDGAEPDGREL